MAVVADSPLGSSKLGSRLTAGLGLDQPARLHRRRAVALAGFLAWYRGLTREAYALDLRQVAS